jgi:hypothetical protein
LDFDGTDDVITITNATAIDFDTGLATGVTFSGWLNADAAGEGTGGQVFYKGANTWCRVDTLGTTDLDFECSLDLATTDATLNVADALTTNTWYHFALTYADDGDDEITLYINGAKKGSSTNGVGGPATGDANNLLLGGTTTNNFNGTLDEFKVFSGELRQSQVAHEYSRGEPVAWYRFDECTGATANDAAEIMPLPTLRPNSTITIGGTDAYTATGNCTSGTSTHAWYAGASGKYGSALALDGADDYAVSPNAALVVPTSGTYSGVSWGAWVKPISSAASKTIIHKNNEFRLTTNASSQPVCQIYALSWQTGATHSTALSLDTWSHVMCVYNGSTITTYIDGIASSTQAETDAITSTNTTALSIGRDSAGSGYVQGLLDEVRIYNYPLSPVQLQQVMAGGSVRFE